MLEIGQPMHAFDLERLALRRIVVRRARRRRADAHARRRRSDARRRHARDRRRRARRRHRRRHGRSELRGLGDDTADRARKRVLRADVGAAHEQATGPENRSLRRDSNAAAMSTCRRRASRAPPRCFAQTRRRCAAGADSSIAIRRRDCLDTIQLRSSQNRAAAGTGRSARRTWSEVPRSRSGSVVTPQRPATIAWSVTVPTFRVDVTREEDLIEEVGRHYGFDRSARSFSGARHRAAAARSRHRPRSTRSAGAHLGGILRGDDVRVHRASGGAAVLRTGRSNRRRFAIRCPRSSRCCARRCFRV